MKMKWTALLPLAVVFTGLLVPDASLSCSCEPPGGRRQTGSPARFWYFLNLAAEAYVAAYRYSPQCRFLRELQKRSSYIGWRDGSHSDASHNPHKGG